MKNLSLIVLMIGLFLIGACTEESQLEMKEVSTNKLSAKQDYDFSIYGVSHNNKLDFIAAMPDFDRAKLQELYNRGNEYSDEHFKDVFNDYSEHQARQAFSKQLIENPKQAAKILQQADLIMPVEYDLMDRLSGILDNAANYKKETFKSVEEFTAEIEALESDIKNNHVVIYNPQTKHANYAARMLAMCSVSKASYAYWIEVATNEKHPWHFRLENMITYNGGEKGLGNFFRKVWRAIKIGALDTWGFITNGEGDGEGNITWNVADSIDAAGDASGTVE